MLLATITTTYSIPQSDNFYSLLGDVLRRMERLNSPLQDRKLQLLTDIPINQS